MDKNVVAVGFTKEQQMEIEKRAGISEGMTIHL